MMNVVLLAGQSNMRGHGEVAKLLAGPLPPRVHLHDENHNPAYFGPERSFARRVLADTNLENLHIVKMTVGGTSLLAWSPNWTAECAAVTKNEEDGALYPRLVRQLKSLRNPDTLNILGCLWMQGERDARYEVSAIAYERNLRRLIAHLRADVNDPNLPFIHGMINPPISGYPYVALVRDAQRRVTDSGHHITLVHTDDLSKHADQLHYDTSGQLILGERFAEALRPYIAQRVADVS